MFLIYFSCSLFKNCWAAHYLWLVSVHFVLIVAVHVVLIVIVAIVVVAVVGAVVNVVVPFSFIEALHLRQL